MPAEGSGPPVEAVLLDAGGVLLLPDPAVLLPVLADARAWPDPALLVRAHYVAIAALDSSADGAWASYVGAFATAVGVPDERLPAAVASLLEAVTSHVWVQSTDGAAAAVQALLDAGLRVAVVSNAEGTVEQMLATAGVCQVGPGAGAEVAAVLDSYLVGSAKPDPGIMRLGLAAVEATPETTAFVGDTLRYDVAGAEACGVRALHLDPWADCPRPAGHEHLRGLADLPALLRPA